MALLVTTLVIIGCHAVTWGIAHISGWDDADVLPYVYACAVGALCAVIW